MSPSGTWESSRSPAWLAGIVAVSSAVVMLADQLHHSLLDWGWWFAIAPLAWVVIWFVVAAESSINGATKGWGRVFAYRCLVFLNSAAWMGCTDKFGWNIPIVIWMVVFGLLVLSVIGHYSPAPPPPPPKWKAHEPEPEPEPDRRPHVIQTWEELIRRITKIDVTVVDCKPWDIPANGMRLTVELPDDGSTIADIEKLCDKIASARRPRLEKGCTIQAIDGHVLGVVYLDVMLRNLFTQPNPVHIEPTTASSVDEPTPFITTPRGEEISVPLRQECVVVGGTTGSGKTTFLHYLIMRMARWANALIWVFDYNGGGVAAPWIEAWANGEAENPIVDWIATDPVEAAVMGTVACHIAKDRKTSRLARLMKRKANTTILPVSKDMPAIFLIGDEGAEVRQAAGLFAILAEQWIVRAAQIGRAEGLRVVWSILRGTSDALSKALRVVCSVRICLRMAEHEEYSYVLDANPGKVDLQGVPGAAFLRTAQITRPLLGITANVEPDGIYQHSIDCARLRPQLDERGCLIASNVRPEDVLEGCGKEVSEEHMEHQAMQDCDEGLAYANRWLRQALLLAELRGEDITPAEPFRDIPVEPGLAKKLLEAAVGDDGEQEDEKGPQPVAPRQPSPARYASRGSREKILNLVRDAGPEGIGTNDLMAASEMSKSAFHEMLKKLREEELLAKNGADRNVLPAHATAAV